MGFLESPQNTQKSQKRSAAKRLNAEFFLREKPCKLPCSGSSHLCLLCFLWSQTILMGKRAFLKNRLLRLPIFVQEAVCEWLWGALQEESVVPQLFWRELLFGEGLPAFQDGLFGISQEMRHQTAFVATCLRTEEETEKPLVLPMVFREALEDGSQMLLRG